MFPVISPCNDAVSLDLFLQSFDSVKLPFITCMFNEINADMPAVNILIEVKNMCFYVLFIGPDRRLNTDICNTWMSYAVNGAQCNVNTVWRSDHRFINRGVACRESKLSPVLVALNDFTVN